MKATIHFDAPVIEFAQAAGLKLSTAMQLISLDLLRRIVQRTPAKTGRARSSWDMTLGSPSDFLPPEIEGTAPAADPMQKFTSSFAGGGMGFHNAAAGIDGLQAVYIVSNLPYIEPLENGHSKQAPAGMVRLSMAEVSVEIEHLLGQLKE